MPYRTLALYGMGLIRYSGSKFGKYSITSQTYLSRNQLEGMPFRSAGQYIANTLSVADKV